MMHCVSPSESDDESGGSVSLSANGQVVAIGAFKNDGIGSDSGHVRVYELDWTIMINDTIGL